MKEKFSEMLKRQEGDIGVWLLEECEDFKLYKILQLYEKCGQRFKKLRFYVLNENTDEAIEFKYYFMAYDYYKNVEMLNMTKTFWSVKYSICGTDSYSIAWFDNYKTAKEFAREDYCDNPVKHTYKNKDSIRLAEFKCYMTKRCE